MNVVSRTDRDSGLHVNYPWVSIEHVPCRFIPWLGTVINGYVITLKGGGGSHLRDVWAYYTGLGKAKEICVFPITQPTHPFFADRLRCFYCATQSCFIVDHIEKKRSKSDHSERSYEVWRQNLSKKSAKMDNFLIFEEKSHHRQKLWTSLQRLRSVTIICGICFTSQGSRPWATYTPRTPPPPPQLNQTNFFWSLEVSWKRFHLLTEKI